MQVWPWNRTEWAPVLLLLVLLLAYVGLAMADSKLPPHTVPACDEAPVVVAVAVSIWEGCADAAA